MTPSPSEQQPHRWGAYFITATAACRAAALWRCSIAEAAFRLDAEMRAAPEHGPGEYGSTLYRLPGGEFAAVKPPPWHVGAGGKRAVVWVGPADYTPPA